MEPSRVDVTSNTMSLDFETKDFKKILQNLEKSLNVDLDGNGKVGEISKEGALQAAEKYYNRDLDGNGQVGTVTNLFDALRALELVSGLDLDGSGVTGAIASGAGKSDATASGNNSSSGSGSSGNDAASNNAAGGSGGEVASATSSSGGEVADTEPTETSDTTPAGTTSSSNANAATSTSSNVTAETEVVDGKLATSGRVWGDPHFEDSDGGKYDVQGEGGKYYNLLSDKGIQVNGLFTEAGSKATDGTPMTVITALGITTGNGDNIEIKDGTAYLNGKALADNSTTDLKNAAGEVVGKIVDQGNTIVVESGEYKITTQAKGAFDIKFESPDVKADGVMPDGLWGQSVDEDKVGRTATDLQGTGAIEGSYKDYEVRGLFDTNFAKNNSSDIEQSTKQKNLSKEEVKTIIEQLEKDMGTDFDWNGTVGTIDGGLDHLRFPFKGIEGSMGSDIDMNGKLYDVTNYTAAVEGIEAKRGKDYDGDGVIGRTSSVGVAAEQGATPTAGTSVNDPASTNSNRDARAIENLEIALNTDFDWNGVVGVVDALSNGGNLKFAFKGAEVAQNRDFDGDGKIGSVTNLDQAIQGAEAFLQKDLDGGGTIGA